MEILKDWKDLIPFGGRFQYYGKNKKNEKELKKNTVQKILIRIQ